MIKKQFSLSEDPDVIVFNLKKRYTGVSATVNALLPLQLQQWQMSYCGTTLSNGIPGMSLKEVLNLSRKPSPRYPFRIWHVRRDHEMMFGLLARDFLRLPIKLVFTSAAQHLHGFFPRWLISRMDAVICTTPLAESFIPNSTAVVPHGIDLLRFTPPSQKLNAWKETGLPGQYGIGVFGRVRPDKGTDVFVDAMIAALPSLPGCTAIIAGLAQPKHLEYQKNLQRKIDDANLSDRILFIGEVTAGKVHEWYQRCLLCIACPRYEPFGLTPFEAAATGCALICSRTGAFDQLVEPGINGQLVDTSDVSALAKATIEIMKDPNLAEKMGIEANKKVREKFSLEKEALGIAQVYKKLFNTSND